MTNSDAFELAKPATSKPTPTFIWFVGWLSLCIGGFVYVAIVLCQRTNPIASGNNEMLDFSVTMFVLSTLYWVGPRWNWPAVEVSWPSIMSWNLLFYTLPFFAALHWEFVGKVLGTQFSLKSSDMAKLDSPSLIALIAAISFLSTLLFLHLKWAYQESRLMRFAGWLIVAPIIVVIVSIILANTHYVHVHHYCLGLFLFPFFQFRNRVSFVPQAFLLGLTVEGISRWGMDPVWYTY